VRALTVIVLVGCASGRPVTPDPSAVCGVPGAELARRCGDTSVTATAFDGAIKLRYAIDGAEVRPSWAVVGALPPADATVDAAAGTLCTPSLRVQIDDACRVRVTDANGRVLVDDAAPFTVGDSAKLERVAPGDRVYGLGERVGGLDKRGRAWTFWNTDAYDPALGGWKPDQDPLYQSIPFEVRFKDGIAHGLFTDEARRMVIDLGASRDTITALGARSLEQWVIAGPEIATVVDRYTQLTGRPAVPPRWALGFHQSRWGYPDGATVEAVAARFRAEGIPADALWLDIQHMRGFRTFTVDDALFPPGMFARLRAQGFKVIAIADPGIKVDPTWNVYQSGVDGGHFLDYEGNAWPGTSKWPDFSRPETRAWWGGLVDDTADRGIDGIWLDVNEPTTFPEGGGGTTIPDAVPAHGDGQPTTLAQLHNVYALLQAKATYEALAARGEQPFVLSRAGYAGIQRYAAVWTGDAPSTWSALQQQLPMLLGLGMSGVPIVGSDIGGYSGNASPELYARWLAFGSLSPFSRAHVTNNVPGQEPWMFGPEVTDIARARIGDRYWLLPYIYSLADEAARTGAPILRPLVWHFPDDAKTHDLGDQAMLGSSIMVAPVLVQGATSRAVYLPAGRWYELHAGAIHEGPATIQVSTTLAALPLFVRAGSIVPATDGIDVYPGTAGSFTLVEDDGRTQIEISDESDGMRVTVGGTKPRVIRVHGVGAATGNFDANARVLTATVTGEAKLVFDKASDPAPPIAVTFEVRVPADSPGTISVAVSANNWTHVTLTRVAPDLARGTVMVPRGEWFEYKYGRGDWNTVEKTTGCGERPNRYRFGAPKPQTDAVTTWRDRC
jgi:alpha-glucosidase